MENLYRKLTSMKEAFRYLKNNNEYINFRNRNKCYNYNLIEDDAIKFANTKIYCNMLKSISKDKNCFDPFDIDNSYYYCSWNFNTTYTDYTFSKLNYLM